MAVIRKELGEALIRTCRSFGLSPSLGCRKYSLMTEPTSHEPLSGNQGGKRAPRRSSRRFGRQLPAAQSKPLPGPSGSLPLGQGAEVIFIQGAFGVQEAESLAKQLGNEINWQQREVVVMGRRVQQPRLTAFQADSLDLTYTYSKVTLTPEPWHPAVLEVKVSRCWMVTIAQWTVTLKSRVSTKVATISCRGKQKPQLDACSTAAC